MTPLTLALYTEGYKWRLSRQWDMCASFMSLFANANAARGKSFSPEDFHPLMDVKSQSVDPDEVRGLMEKMKQINGLDS
jgi:hypothetical protein